MKITVLTLFPEFFDSFQSTSIIKRAIEQGKVEFETVDFRKYTLDKHNHVDDTPYGGGQGMVLSCQPIVDCLKDVRTEVSLGDFVLTGGEGAALVISDAIIRLLDDVIRKESHADDSFENGLLEYPQYTRPVEYDGKKVPDVLLSGHHANIRRWRLKQSLLRTMKKRPDLLKGREFSKEEVELMEEIKKDLE